MKIVLIQYDDHKIFVCTTHFESELINQYVINCINTIGVLIYYIKYIARQKYNFFCADTSMLMHLKLISIRHLLINMDGKTHG